MALALCAHDAFAGDELISTARQADGELVPYVLNANNASPRYVVILFPGGSGRVDPHMEDGQVAYGFRGNFLVRTRPLIVDEEFATVTTNTTVSEERVQALLDDIARRFPAAKVYLMGTSNGTGATMQLADYLSGRIAGEIHTSSLMEIQRFDTRRYKNRHLIVHHKRDICRVTPYFAAESAHERYGTDFIPMDGGVTVGDPCEARAYHGYNGIERETIEAIKKWVKLGG